MNQINNRTTHRNSRTKTCSDSYSFKDKHLWIKKATGLGII